MSVFTTQSIAHIRYETLGKIRCFIVGVINPYIEKRMQPKRFHVAFREIKHSAVHQFPIRGIGTSKKKKTNKYNYHNIKRVFSSSVGDNSGDNCFNSIYKSSEIFARKSVKNVCFDNIRSVNPQMTNV